MEGSKCVANYCQVPVLIVCLYYVSWINPIIYLLCFTMRLIYIIKYLLEIKSTHYVMDNVKMVMFK